MRQSSANTKSPGTKNRLSPTVTVMRWPANAPGDELPEEPAGAAALAALVRVDGCPVAPAALPPPAPGAAEDPPGLAATLVADAAADDGPLVPPELPDPPEPGPGAPGPVMSLEMSLSATL